jgi:hypothetical protein
MLDQYKDVEFSGHDLEVIEEALFTQEKILSVQSRAGGNAAKVRLNELQGLLRRVRSQRGGQAKQPTGIRAMFARVLCS